MRSTNAIMHPEYQWSPRKNDIGIIITPSPITLDQYVSVVSLSPLHTIIPLEYEQIRISGFGSRSNIAGENSENLQTTYQIVTSIDKCTSKYQMGNSNFFCAQSSSNWCQEDRGGGATLFKGGARILVGVATHYSTTCASVDVPSAYTDITPFREWILLNAGI